MEDLEQNFRVFLQEENLVNSKILLAVSGGVDSTVLFHLALSLCEKKNIAVFHLDHGVRKDSGEDIKNIEQICHREGIPIFIEKLQTTSSRNRENFWREQRNFFYNQYIKKFSAKKVLTAHHATDLVETMIFRLVKGCGLEGISPFNTSQKPLWKTPKSDIINYAKKYNLQWTEESTNQDNTFQRNLIRNEILPLLRQINPHLEKVFVAESQNFRENFITLQNLLDSPVYTYSETEGVSLTNFKCMDTGLRKMFLRKHVKHAPSIAEMEDFLRWVLASPQGGQWKILGGTKIQLTSGHLYFTDLE